MTSNPVKWFLRKLIQYALTEKNSIWLGWDDVNLGGKALKNASVTVTDLTATALDKISTQTRLSRLPAFDDPIEGTLSPAALGTEYDVVVSEVGVSHYLEGWIDLSAMAAGDAVEIAYYVSLVTPVSYKLYAKETYSDAQAIPALHIVTLPARYGIKVTLKQTAGTLRSFPYQIFRRRTA